jgi:hypothetical protein
MVLWFCIEILLIHKLNGGLCVKWHDRSLDAVLHSLFHFLQKWY